MKLGFGKYGDRELCDVPEDYLLWLIGNSKEKIKTYEKELERRTLAEEATMDMMEKLIKAGYRALATKLHPDRGGTDEQMRELNATYERLNKGKAFNNNPSQPDDPPWKDV